MGAIRIGRLVNVGYYEHLRIEVEMDFKRPTGKQVKALTEDIERWASLAKDRIHLLAEMKNAQEFFDRIRGEAKQLRLLPSGEIGQPPEEEDYQRQELEKATVRVEHIKRDLAEVDEGW